MVQNYLIEAMAAQQLPGEFAQTLRNWYLPLAEELASALMECKAPVFLGVQGCQGSGKSTLAEFLRLMLSAEHQLRVLVLSIDDFYLTRAERQQLAANVHPLFITRGVPGTHDITLALKVFAQLETLGEGQSIAIPRFNKALDDRYPETEWDRWSGPVDLVILEGWCVGLKPESQERLGTPINRLEREEDAAGHWRSYVNRQLAGHYQQLFNRLQYLVVLSAPSFDAVYQWRLLQEQKLARRWQQLHPDKPAQIQTPAQLERFIAHYQRLTEWALLSLPGQADVEFSLDQEHQIFSRRPAPGQSAWQRVVQAPDP